MKEMTYDELKAKYDELKADLKNMTAKYNKAADQAYERLSYLKAVGGVSAVTVVGVIAYFLV